MSYKFRQKKKENQNYVNCQQIATNRQINVGLTLQSVTLLENLQIRIYRWIRFIWNSIGFFGAVGRFPNKRILRRRPMITLQMIFDRRTAVNELMLDGIYGFPVIRDDRCDVIPFECDIILEKMCYTLEEDNV